MSLSFYLTVVECGKAGRWGFELLYVIVFFLLLSTVSYYHFLIARGQWRGCEAVLSNSKM
ncbi:hypothetical protein K432DRAFT_43526 [Lepidopterella palustris CBS 459.81]|uniref:Uncharacterized protein n=1 Tax=Lepidopterella palustris CBS 459.81 TaxID=1314670 RepID=A0A8E2DW87_9PEZI|nr:hypothetical protein K432DRAFT_43526 [Lepidopterella palustris CBS 459.81]